MSNNQQLKFKTEVQIQQKIGLKLQTLALQVTKTQPKRTNSLLSRRKIPELFLSKLQIPHQ